MSNIRRFDPFGEMLSLRDAMGQLFEDSFVNPARMGSRDALGMALDVSETQDSFVVDAVVPGLKPEDLDITIQDNVLMIRGETRQEQQTGQKQANYHVMERHYGRFSRAVSLPTAVNADQVRATLEHGILHLEIPKAEQVKPRKITVNNSSAHQQTVDVNAQSEQS
ncbi:MAG: Hsp20/alpha crystallin family protein [Chloroflexota bacterium]|nr:Hsp20/alpha crystallin family protein [Chloroflexota bacterium]